MRCEDCLPLLEAFADGAPGGADDAGVSAHLASCHACSETVEMLQEEQEMYAGYWREAGFKPPRWSSVLAAVERDRDARAGSHAPGRGGKWAALLNFWRLRPAAATALALAALVVGLLGLSQLTRRAPQPERELAGSPPSPAANAEATTHRASGEDLTASASAPSVSHESETTRREPTTRATVRPVGVRRPGAGHESASALTTSTHASGRVSSPPVVVEAASFERARLLGSEMAATSSLPTPADAPSLSDEMSRHFGHMELLFRSLKNAGRGGAGQTVDVSYEKGLSRRLLNRNVLLRREAESRGNLPLEEMLDSVEPVFAEIANLPAQSSPADLSLIEERVQKKGVVALLRAYLTKPAPEAARDSF